MLHKWTIFNILLYFLDLMGEGRTEAVFCKYTDLEKCEDALGVNSLNLPSGHATDCSGIFTALATNDGGSV